MTKTFFLVFLIPVLLFIQCEKDELKSCPDCNFNCVAVNDEQVVTNDCNEVKDCEFTFQKGASLDFQEELYVDKVNIGNGNQRVFHATWTTGNLSIDAGIMHHVYFSLNENLESFSLEDSTLSLINLRYQQLCFCANNHAVKPSGGCIEGKKIDGDTWRVQMNLVFDFNWGQIPVKIDAEFKE